MDTKLRILKAKIKGFSEESRYIRRKFIHPFSGPKRANGWTAKRNLGEEARYHHLAYGFLRGRTYREMEQKTEVGKGRMFYFDFNYLLRIIKEHAPWKERDKWTDAYLTEQFKDKKQAA